MQAACPQRRRRHRGLDRELRPLERLVLIAGRDQPAEGRRAVLLADLAPRDALVEVGGDGRETAVGRGLIDVEQVRGDAALGEDLGDAVAHGPGAEHGGPLDGFCLHGVRG